ncbi:helix-turn-helix domain-containing protein [Falsiroseomonas sp.]|uniref:helix-turn-helix domain-containing protein n=1 Tax=Falsiroseomonas sp. TaxID=2870721 RepID=UPI003F6E6508
MELEQSPRAVDGAARARIDALRARVARLEADPLYLRHLPRAGMDRTIAAVAEEFGIAADAILGECRSREIALPRQVAMALAHRVLGYSTPRIGRLLGRDPSTVLHGCQRIASLAAADAAFGARLDELSRAIRLNSEGAK